LSDDLYSSGPHQERDDDLYGSASAGTPKLAGIFFGVAVLCAIFFSIGYKMGKVTSAAAPMAANPRVISSPPVSLKPSAAVEDPIQQTAAPVVASASSPTRSISSAPKAQPVHAAPEMAHAGSGNFAVQVAAVSRQEDADALESALRSKSYPVFVVNQPGDKLFHVQVGPFGSLADAEAMKAKLAGDGYNPILKK
jgi:cell division septation protein DedD